MTTRTGPTVWILFAALAVLTDTVSAITVIYDTGQTRSLAPYLAGFGVGFDRSRTQPETASPRARPELGAANLDRLLPIRSPGLTPGQVIRQLHTRPFVRPVFLIGSDPLSRQWLAANRERFAGIGAVGMLVEARTVKDLRVIAALANGLPILPASASDIARALSLAHYPVLITSHGVEQ